VIAEGVEDMVPVDADPDLALAPVMCAAGGGVAVDLVVHDFVKLFI
jgi:hypothetical protein